MNLKTITETKLWIFFIIAVSILCYCNIYKNEFLFDDLPAITENEATRPPIDLYKIFFTPSWWTEKESRDLKGYRPLTTLSFSVNRAIHGLSVGGYHTVNVAIHVANSVVIYFIIFLIFKRKILAGITSIFFVTHPLHTEAVAGIVARADELAAFFVLLALFSYIKAWQFNFPKSILFLFLSCLCLLAGLASKESAACFFLIIIVYELCINYFPLKEKGEINTKIITTKVVVLVLFILITLVYIFWWRTFITGQFGDIVIKDAATPAGLLHNRPVIWRLTAFKAFAYYIKLLIYPVKLSGDYLYNQIPLANQISDPLVLTGLILFIGLLCFGFWALFKGHTVVAFGVFFLYAAYAPVSNFLIPIGALVGERLFYLPSLGFCLVIALICEFIFKLLKRKTSPETVNPVIILILAAIIAGYGYRTIDRNKDWKNPYVFFSKTSRTSPGSAVSHYSTAVAYLLMIEDQRYIERWMTPDEIQELKAKEFKGRLFLIKNGFKSISRALEITKEDPKAEYLNVYGALLAINGKYEKAKHVLKEAINKDPYLMDAKITLAATYLRLVSKLKKEKNSFKSSILVKKYLVESVKYLQEAKDQQGDLASKNAEHMVKIYLNLSIANQHLGRLDSALESINNALVCINRYLGQMDRDTFITGRVYLIKASILADRKDFKGAITMLSKAKLAGFPRFRRYALKMKQFKPLQRYHEFQELVK